MKNRGMRLDEDPDLIESNNKSFKCLEHIKDKYFPKKSGTMIYIGTGGDYSNWLKDKFIVGI